MKILEIFTSTQMVVFYLAIVFFWKFSKEFREILNRGFTLKSGDKTLESPSQSSVELTLDKPEEIKELPEKLSGQEKEDVETLKVKIKETREALQFYYDKSTRFEYLHLDEALVDKTRAFLRWLASYGDKGVNAYDLNLYLNTVETDLSCKNNMITVLASYALYSLDGGKYYVTEKGKKYLEYRAKEFPAPPPDDTGLGLRNLAPKTSKPK